MSIALSHARILSPDGRCKTFDAAADGYGRGEGCGVVILKRLSDAVAEGDRIIAQIRGTSVNQDGPSSGLTAPNGPAQEAVIRQALESAGLTPNEVGFIEAHGTVRNWVIHSRCVHSEPYSAPGGPLIVLSM